LTKTEIKLNKFVHMMAGKRHNAWTCVLEMFWIVRD